MSAATLPLLLAVLLGPVSQEAEGEAPPRANASAADVSSKSAATSKPCAYPVIFKRARARCSERPVATAFGRVTWMEAGRSWSASASEVDLERTRAAQQKSVRAAGGFSMTGQESAAAAVPDATGEVTTPARPWYEPEVDARPQPAAGAQARASGLSAEQRAGLQAELHRAEVELEVLEKNYRALVLTGAQPTNTLSSAINRRKSRIRDLRSRLSRGE